MLPAGYLSTNGNQIVDQAGNDVRIASVGWNQNFSNIDQNVAAMAADGFNCIRLSWVDATLSSDLSRIEHIVSAAAAHGIKVILDHHTDEAGTPADGYGSQQKNGLWYDVGPGSDGTNGAGVTGTVSNEQFQADWLTVARAFAGNSTVIGFDLDNEPLTYGNSPSGGVNWGGGGANDIQAMYQNTGNAIQTIDPGALIIAEGPIGDGQGGNPSGFDLSQVANHPVTLNVANKVVYSVHDYPTAIGAEPVDSGPGAVQLMNTTWGYLETQNIAPVWVGEIGASLDGTADSAGGNLAEEQNWAATMVAYMNGQDGSQGGPSFSGGQQGISTDWWDWGYNPGQYPDGVLNGDGSINAGQQAVYSQFQYHPTSTPNPTPVFPASANDTVVTGTTGTIQDASGNAWTITASGQVAINGTADVTTANVTELAYVDGAVWQENASKGWWGETTPNGGWTLGSGTTTSPLPVTVTPPPTPVPPVTVTPPPTPITSPNDTIVLAGSTAAIQDGKGNAWSITASGQVAVNGAADATTANVKELAYVNGAVWQENTASLWWSKTLPTDQWAGGSSTSPVPVKPVASPNDTTVAAGSATIITDAAGNAWSLTSSGQVAVGGVADALTANVTELAYVDGTVWQENQAGLWWGKAAPSDAWGPAAGTATSPLPAPAQVPVSISVTPAGATLQINSLTAAGTTLDGDVFSLGTDGVIQAVLGSASTSISVLGATPVNLTGGSAAASVLTAATNNTFTPGSGALTVTGGPGADSYVFHAGSGLLTITDFSVAKGDTLTADASLSGSLQQASDGNGGTMISFGGSNAIDVRGMTTVPAADIAFK